MPLILEYKAPVIWIYVTGALSGKELMEGAEIMAVEEARHAVTPHRITDLTGSSNVELGFDEILALATMRRTMEFPTPFKSAIVTGNEVQMGFARMFQTLNNNPKIAIKIFTDQESALVWLAS